MTDILSNKKLLIVIGVASVAMSLISLVSGRRSSLPEIDTDLHRTVGRVMAEEAIKALGDGDQLVLVVPVCVNTPLRAVDAQVEAFEKTLKKLGKGQILAREKITAPSPQLDDLFTADAYLRLVQKYPGAKAVVCFAGIKPFGERDLADAAGKPPVCVVSMSGPVQNELVEKNVVRLAMIPRGWARGESAEEIPGQTAEFNNRFALMKP